MNAIERDRTRKLISGLYEIPHKGGLESDIRYRAQSLLGRLIHKDGEQVELDGVQCDINALIYDVRAERERRNEAAELAAELAALEAKDSK